MDTIPAIVEELADEVVLDPENTAGAATKLRWADRWDGTYFACDDDLAYPPDFCDVLERWLEHWGRRAIVSTHGRVLRPSARSFFDTIWTCRTLDELPRGRWVNWLGACALAFDTALEVPATFPGRNLEEPCLAVWAQERRVPLWVVPHPAGWLEYLLDRHVVEPDPTQPGYTIWCEEKAGGFVNRDAPIAAYGSRHLWTVHEQLEAAA